MSSGEGFAARCFSGLPVVVSDIIELPNSFQPKPGQLLSVLVPPNILAILVLHDEQAGQTFDDRVCERLLPNECALGALQPCHAYDQCHHERGFDNRQPHTCKYDNSISFPGTGFAE